MTLSPGLRHGASLRSWRARRESAGVRVTQATSCGVTGKLWQQLTENFQVPEQKLNVMMLRF